MIPPPRARTLVVLLCLAVPAWADLLAGTAPGSALDTEQVAYTYVPARGGGDLNWAQRQLRDMQIRRERSTMTRSLSVHALGAIAARAEAADAVSGTEPEAPGFDSPDSTSGAPSAGLGSAALPSVGGGGRGGGNGGGADLDMDFSEMEALLAAEALKDMPGLAIDAATAFETYANRAFALILGSGTTLDWRSLILYRAWLQSENERDVDETRRKRAKKSASELENEKKIQAELRRKKFQRAVRSAFKVFAGVALGLALWIIVRKSGRGGRVRAHRRRYR
ncbi:MAG: hypothetical protein ACYTGN_04495 [Planctomycetota bacterium]|jgi:hypothetical protein